MEDFIGKICPFCKTEIKENEETIVCPSCNTPHHKGCWEENKGCTTFGCSEQYYEEQHTNPTDVCANCGTPLGDGQAFCPKCGTAKVEIKQNICSKCGTELQEGQEFCPKCGQKVGLNIDEHVSTAINQFNQNISVKKKPKKIGLIILSILVIFSIIGTIGYIGITNKRKSELHKALMAEEWWSYDDGTKLYLDFSVTAPKWPPCTARPCTAPTRFSRDTSWPGRRA